MRLPMTLLPDLHLNPSHPQNWLLSSARLKFQGADPVAKEPEACPAEPASAAQAEPAEEVDVGRGMEDLGLGKYFVYMHVTGYDLH